jgi:hypothetical protein
MKPKGEVYTGKAGIIGLTYLEAKRWLNMNKKISDDDEPKSGCFADSRGIKNRRSGWGEEDEEIKQDKKTNGKPTKKLKKVKDL